MHYEDNMIELQNGKWLWRSYGKYRGNLTYICPKETSPNNFRANIEIEDIKKYNEQTRHFDGNCEIFFGEYRQNAKGTNVFEFGNKNSHVLIVVDWGGGFSRSRGGQKIKMPDYCYCRVASSNGGGTGTTFYIFPLESFELIGKGLTEDDF